MRSSRLKTRFLSVFCLFFCLSVGSAIDWQGRLQIQPAEGWRSGATVQLKLQSIKKSKKGDEVFTDVFQGRAARVHLTPLRFNLFAADPIQIDAPGDGAGNYRITLPAGVQTDYYLLSVAVGNDKGAAPNMAYAAEPGKDRGNRFAMRAIAIRGAETGPFIRVHTERARCVFSPGEEIRFFVSARGRQAMRQKVAIGLYPTFDGVKPVGLGQVELNVPAGQEATVALDLSAAGSAAIAPGDYSFVAVSNNKVVDRYPVRFVAGERPSSGARWAHTMGLGYSGGLNAAPVTDKNLHGHHARGRHFEQIERVHNANLWVNFFTNAYPIRSWSLPLPEGDRANLPPVAAQFRPSATHALYQKVMAEGIALGVTVGYGEDYRAETYMPIPTVVEDHIAVMARKYLNAAMGAAFLPNFVALYTDYYGHLDIMGAGELSGDETRTIRQTAWDQASKHAGMNIPRPNTYPFDPKKMPAGMKERFNKGISKKWWEYLRSQGAGNSRHLSKWLSQNYPTEADKQGLWRAAWAHIGVTPPPTPPQKTPVPKLDDATAEKVGPAQAYAYAEWMLSGFQRAYGTFTDLVETETPAVFTIHNKGTMNHSSTSHAWSGYRSPNIDPAYLSNGASAISVSEWNLDGVPKPYFLTTFYNRTLVDDGHPVYRCGLWKQAGSPTRWMRDTIFWMGRQIHTYYDQTGNMTWSQLGADQTTFASNERLSQVTELHSYFSDLANQLEPVREIGMYIPAYGSPWGDAVTNGHYIGMVAGLMSDHQIHMVSHGDIAKDRLKNYPVLYAPGMKARSMYPHERQGIQAFQNQGGELLVTPLRDYYHPEEALNKHGIYFVEEPVLNDAGQQVMNKDGSPKVKRSLPASFDKWAKITQDWNWDGFSDVHVADLWVNDTFSHLDESGQKAQWKGSHWTGHHKWAPIRGGALHQHEKLAKAFDQLHDPIIRKDQPEVFVNVCRPKDARAQGLFVFASNWKLPTTPDLFEYRVPQGFFKSMVEPVSTELRLKADVGAIYDVIACREVPFTRAGDRVVFRADLDSVEGRIFAAYPEKISSAALLAPTEVTAGEQIAARFVLRGGSGADLSVLGSVRLRLLASDGTVLQDMRRALPADGALPLVTAPGTVGGQCVLEVVDTITGQRAEAAIAVRGRPKIAQVAAPVTVARGDRIHQWLQEHRSLTIVVDAGALKVDMGKGTVALPQAHERQAELMQWAATLKTALARVGLQATIATSDAAAAAPLAAHPWTGKMAGYRQRNSVPNVHIDGPVVLLGDPAERGILHDLDRSMVAPRSLGTDNVTAGRAVVAWMPRIFSTDSDSILVAAHDAAGVKAAAAALAEIAQRAPAADSFYEARERVRQTWAPGEVDAWKAQRGLIAPASTATSSAALKEYPAQPGWSDLATTVGTAIVQLSANESGVAVGTKSWAKPVGLLNPAGEVLGFWGGGVEVTPRDVGLSADGRKVYGGFGLFGYAAGYEVGRGQVFRHQTPIAYSDTNPFGWDSFKDSDRGIGISPDGQTAVVIAGPDQILAYDTATNQPRWTIGTVAGNRPRGKIHPEIAFSSDSRWVLLAPFIEDAQTLSVTYTVQVPQWDAARRRYNKKKRQPQEQRVNARWRRQVLMLVDVATGKPQWQRTTAAELYDAETGLLIWQPGKEPQLLVENDPRSGRPERWLGSKDQPPQANGRQLSTDGIDTLGMWHLYSAVGPQGRWSIAGTRDAHIVLLDESGKTARRFESDHLPAQLDPGQQIAPVFLSSNDPDHLFAYAPQGRSVFLMHLRLGSQQDRQKAAEAQAEASAVLNLIRQTVGNRKGYKQFGKKDFMESFAQKIASVPAPEREALLARMRKLPGELRAKRKRDSRWFAKQVNDVRTALLIQNAPLADRAASLATKQQVDLPAMVHHAAISDDMQFAYLGLWDETVRCYNLRTGEEIWSTPVVGGCKVDVVGEHVYAGGSRGDVYRLQAATGALVWQTNISGATNQLD